MLSDAKEQIKQTPISSIISHYVSLSRRGTNFLGLCPFHQDSKPSLTVNDQKGMFMCFACQTGGDAITFVEKYRNVDFKEAIKEIADFLGFEVEVGNQKKNPEFEMAYKILSASAKLYRKNAEQDTKNVYQSFVAERKISEEIQKQFSIGLAPHHQSLSQYLQTIPKEQKDFAIKTALKIGVIRQSKPPHKGHYDTFRDRIIFPIWDQAGRVVGMGGRATLEGQHGKYINSQESFIFNKKNVLYGLNFAKNILRDKDQVLLVEGYMDVIALHSHGFNEAVGVMGVALSDQSIQTLKNYTKNFVLALDSDSAGMKAMTRMNELCMNYSILPKFLDFSPHKDPDDFLKAEGRLKLLERIEKMPTFLDHLIQKTIPKELPESTDEKLTLLQKVFALVAPLKMELSATERIGNVAKTLKLQSDKNLILKAYQDFLKEHKPLKSQPNTPKTTTNNALNVLKSSESKPLMHHVPVKSIPGKDHLPKSERHLLQEFIKHPECLQEAKTSEILDFISHEEVKKIIQWLKELYYEIEESEYSSIVRDFLTTENISLPVKEAVGVALYHYNHQELNEKTKIKLINDILRKLKQDKLKSKRSRLRIKQQACEDKEELQIILKELLEIEKNLNLLRKKNVADLQT